ncbi:MAG: hypothetical protein P8Y98_00505 [Anaerolineales bacterium]
MIQQTDVLEDRRPFIGVDAYQTLETRFLQRRMRTQRNHEIESFRVAQQLNESTEQKRQRQGASVVRNQDEQTLTCELAFERARKRAAYLYIRQPSTGRGDCVDRHPVSPHPILINCIRSLPASDSAVCRESAVDGYHRSGYECGGG